MRIRSAALALLLASGTAHSDVLVNDRSDPVGANQFGPRVTTAYNNNTIGTMVVALWSVWPNSAGFRFAVAPTGTLAFTQGGSPPVPAGWRWSMDPIVHGAANDVDGFFYVLGTVRGPSLPPTTGLAFVRGRADGPGAVTFDPPQLLVPYGTATQNLVFYGVTDMQVDPSDGSIYLLYQPEVSGGPHRNVYFLRSSNGGASWTRLTRVSTDSLAGIQAPSIACGTTAGDVTLFWQQKDANGTVVMSRHSTDAGNTLGAPVTVMNIPAFTGSSPSHGGEWLPAVTLDRWNPTHAGALLYGSTIPFDLEHDVYPNLGNAPVVSEVEPNGTPATSTPAAGNGIVVRGAISAAADTDWFSFDLLQGQEVNAVDDSAAAWPFYLHLDWVGSDGVSVLSTGNVGSLYTEQHFGIVAPVSARYYLRVTGFNATAPYRLRTVWGTAPSPGAADQRDVAFSRLPAGGAWTGTRAMAPADPIGYDATGLSLAAAADGGVYASYNDFSILPGRALSRRVIRRSADAGATWSAPVTISSANTDWAATSGFDLDRCDLSASDGVNLYVVWTDGRNGDPDVYLDHIERRIYVTSSDPFTATAHPGETVHAIRDVRNADHAESFGVAMIPDASAYGWSLPTSVATLSPGATAPLDCTFQVPSDATPGDYTVTLYYRSVDAPSGATYGIASLALHVLENTGVGDGAPAVLALAPVRPNPLAGPAEVKFSLSRPGHVKLAIYGIDGRAVRVLADGEWSAGEQAARWDGRDESGSRVAPGAYFVVLKAEGRTLTRRLVELR